MHTFTASSGISVSYIGPHLKEGLKPGVLYLALSKEDSLTLSPFNQPVSFLAQNPEVRVFSITLPGHEPPLLKEEAISYWAKHFQKGEDILTPFLEKAALVLDELLEMGCIEKNTFFLMGLSRGGFLALHLAARHSLINQIVAFAPLIKLENAKECEGMQSSSSHANHPLDLYSHLDALSKCKIRFYIGNRDQRVGTKNSFDFITALAELSSKNREKNTSFELFIRDSIGLHGHGTPEFVFKEGAAFIQSFFHE